VSTILTGIESEECNAGIKAFALLSWAKAKALIPFCLIQINKYRTQKETSMADDSAPAALLYLTVLDKYSREALGKIGDIATDAIMLSTERPFPLHQTRDVIIELPNNEQFVKSSVEFQLEGIWQKQETADSYCIGCQLLNANYHDIEMLAVGANEAGIAMAHKRSARKHLLFYLEVYNQHSGELVGHLGDISNTGLMLVGEQALPLNKIFDLNIRLPDLEEFVESGLEVRVETRWTHPDTNPDFHCTGCLLLDIAPEDENVIEQIQDVLGLDT
jgi:hypothetical protein